MIRSNTNTTTIIDKVAEIDAQIDALKKQRQEAVDALVDRLGVGGKAESDTAKVSVVQTTTKAVDIDVLRSVAAPDLFDRVTKIVLDTPALNVAEKAGLLPDEVASLIVLKESAPFIRLTIKK
jgi:hypothetical protein